MKIKVGMIFTIEPMVNLGKYETKTLKDGWTAKRLLSAFRDKIASEYSVATQRKFFSENAMRAYRCVK